MPKATRSSRMRDQHVYRTYLRNAWAGSEAEFGAEGDGDGDGDGVEFDGDDNYDNGIDNGSDGAVLDGEGSAYPRRGVGSRPHRRGRTQQAGNDFADDNGDYYYADDMDPAAELLDDSDSDSERERELEAAARVPRFDPTVCVCVFVCLFMCMCVCLFVCLFFVFVFVFVVTYACAC